MSASGVYLFYDIYVYIMRVLVLNFECRERNGNEIISCTTPRSPRTEDMPNAKMHSGDKIDRSADPRPDLPISLFLGRSGAAI